MSKRCGECLGFIVFPINFSPEGDLGGVCPFGFIDVCVDILEMKIGEGGASNDGPGL
jgi:hypothetical protein